MIQLKIATCVLLILGMLEVQPANAYIDPGTGSILIQGIIAAIAAVGVTLKLYWHRFIGFFRRKVDEEGDDSHDAASRGSVAED